MNRIVKSALNDFSLFVSPLGKNRAIYGFEGVISLKLGYMPPRPIIVLFVTFVWRKSLWQADGGT